MKFRPSVVVIAVALLSVAAIAMLAQTDGRVLGSVGLAAQTTQTVTPPAIAAPTALPQSLGAHPVYVLDIKNGGLVTDLLGIDADARKTISTLALRYVPDLLLSAAGDKLYVLDSYFARVTRGENRDVLSVFDARSLALLTDDVAVPERLRYKLFPSGNLSFADSLDGKYLFVGKYGKPDVYALRLTVLDTTTFQQVAEYPMPQCDGLRIEVMWDGRFLCAQGGALYAVAPLTGAQTKLLDVPAVTNGIAVLSPARDRWIRLDRGGGVTVVDLTDPPRVVENRNIGMPEGHTFGWSYQVNPSEDGTRVYVGYTPTSGDLYGTGVADVIRVFDMRTWELLGELRPDAPIDYMAVSRDGTQLYTTSRQERTLRIFDTGTLKEIGVMREVGISPTQIIVPK